jgi:hypothetical protein
VNFQYCVSRFLFFWLLFCLFNSSATAQLLGAKGASLPMNVVVTPHFRVLHQPYLEAFARHVGAAAELIHSRIIAAVGNDPGITYILINDATDLANGLTVPDPYNFITINATFPRPTDIGAQWEDAMLALATHEFTHLAHLTTRNETRVALRGIFGAIPGILGTRVPPAWFTEGYAVALETRFTSGGRSQDTSVKTLRAQMARAGNFPSLIEAGIGTLERYPFGNTRYAFGAGFVPYLIGRFGDAGIQKVIERFNSSLSFDDAWISVHHVGLTELWNDWQQLEEQRAQTELEALKASQLPAGERLYGGSGVPAVLGNQIVWLEGAAIRFGTWNAGKLEPSEERVKLPTRPNKLSFQNQNTLVYSRILYQSDTSFGEVFKLERDAIGNWRETQLTKNARARDAVSDGNCVMFVNDDTESSSLKKLCDSSTETVFTAPFGWHLFHPTKNKTGQLALTVWRPGGFLDIATLENQQLVFQTSDRAQDQFPIWLPDGKLAFASDRGGSFQAYRINPGSSQIERISAASGGVYGSSVMPNGSLAFAGYTSTGFETRRLEIGKTLPEKLEFLEPRPIEQLDGLEYAIESYNAAPSALFWTPFSATGLGATLYGADPAGINNYTIGAGYSFIGNPGFEADASFSFQPLRNWGLNASANANSSGWSLSLSPAWFGNAQAQGLGVYSYRLTATARGTNTAFELASSFSLKSLIEDEYGYTQNGWATSASISSLGRFGVNLTLADSSLGLPVVLNTSLTQNNFNARISSQFSFSLNWFNSDGLIGIARVSVLPFLGYQFATTPNYLAGTQILLDGVFNYYAPVSVGFEFSYSSLNGFQLGLVTLIPLLNGLRLASL